MLTATELAVVVASAAAVLLQLCRPWLRRPVADFLGWALLVVITALVVCEVIE